MAADDVITDEHLADDQTDQEAPSIDDELGAIVDEIEAREKAEGQLAADADAPAPAVDRPRDESGRFTKADDKPAAQLPKDAAPAQPAAAQPAAFQDKGAPTTWRAEAKAQWNALPEWAKAEIYKREDDAQRGISQYSNKAQVADILMSKITPYQPIMNALGADIPTALDEVLKTAAIFHVGTPEQKAATIRTLAQRHGVDLGQIAGNPAADTFRDPALEQANARIAKLEGIIANNQTAAQHSELQAANGEINAFGSDPTNKYYSDVREMMGRLINSGVINVNQAPQAILKEAYDKACQLHPQVKAALALEASQASDANAAAERARRAESAKRAGQLGVRSAPTPRPTIPATNGSMWDAMEGYMDEIERRAQ